MNARKSDAGRNSQGTRGAVGGRGPQGARGTHDARDAYVVQGAHAARSAQNAPNARNAQGSRAVQGIQGARSSYPRGTGAAAASSPREGRSRTATALPLVAGLVAIIAVVGCLVVACTTRGAQPAYVCPYDWSGLTEIDGRLTYCENGEKQSRLGIDVSHYQGSINWGSVAADGIDFAYVRLGRRGTTEGGLYEDSTWRQNVAGAQAAGLDVGVYFFSQATNAQEGQAEADYVLELLDGRDLELPVAFDWERTSGEYHRTNETSAEDAHAAVQAFCERIEAAGYATMVYGTESDLEHLGVTGGDGPLWLAAYGTAHPDTLFDFSMWQYTSGGSVAGISTSVDLNIWFLTAPQPVA